MKRTWLILSLIAIAGLAPATSDSVTICHYPTGNPENKQTIQVSPDAVSAHLEHGDVLGECAEPGDGKGSYDYGYDEPVLLMSSSHSSSGFTLTLSVKKLAGSFTAPEINERIIARGTEMILIACLTCNSTLVAPPQFIRITVNGVVAKYAQDTTSCVELPINEDDYLSGGMMDVCATAPGSGTSAQSLHFDVVDIPSMVVWNIGTGEQVVELTDEEPVYVCETTSDPGSGVTLSLSPNFVPFHTPTMGARVLFEVTGSPVSSSSPPTADADGDGISSSVDEDDNNNANGTFSDGATKGTITAGGGRIILVADDPNGIRIIVGPGSLAATIEGTSCTPPTTITIPAGQTADFILKCTSPSIELLAGSIEVTVIGVDTEVTVIMTDSGTVSFEQVDEQTLEVTVGEEPVEISVDGGEPVTVQPGETPEFEFPTLDDADDDGVPDGIDACLNSDMIPFVVIGGCTPGIANTVLPTGCTIMDLLNQSAQSPKSHGEYVSRVTKIKNDLVKQGVLSKSQGGKLQKCAAQSSIGK